MAELAVLTRCADEAGTRPGAVTVAAIEGMAGVGKSALAVRWARDTTQIRPLLPGTAACHVPITSRCRLTTLVAETGARTIALGCLTHDESTLLLGRLPGEDRITAPASPWTTCPDVQCNRTAASPQATAVVCFRPMTRPTEYSSIGNMLA